MLRLHCHWMVSDTSHNFPHALILYVSCSDSICPDFALTNWTKIRQNRQFCQVDFTLTNWTKTRQNLQIHEHSLGLTEFHRNLPFFLLRPFLDLSGFARLVNKDTRYQV